MAKWVGHVNVLCQEAQLLVQDREEWTDDRLCVWSVSKERHKSKNMSFIPNLISLTGWHCDNVNHE